MEQSWWNSTASDGRTVEHLAVEQWDICWWNSRIFDSGAVEQMVEWWIRQCQTVDHLMVKQWNI